MSHNIIYSISSADENKLWIVTHGGGLNKFDPAKETFVQYGSESENPYSLSNDVLKDFGVERGAGQHRVIKR